MRMAQAGQLGSDEVRIVMLGMPFRKFEQRKYLAYDKTDLSYVRFSPALWRQLTPDDLALVRRGCQRAIAEYYDRIEP
jgi:hypothetical protein